MIGEPLTAPIGADEYVRVVLVGRQQAWLEAHPTARPYRFPLLEWFIQDGDERFVILPESAPKPASQPRTYRSAASLRAERDKVEQRMAAITGEDTTDGAVVNLSPHSRSRAARNAGRKRFARLDRDLERYARLKRRYDQLTGRIARAEAREARS